MGEPPAAAPDEVRRSLVDTPQAGPATIRGAALRVAGYGIGVLLSIASAALLFRHLGPADGGRYVVVLSLVTIAQGLTEAGLTAIGMRELAIRDGADRTRVMRALIGMRLVFTSVGVLGATAFALVAGYPDVLVLGTLVAGVAVVVQNLQGTLVIALMAELRVAWVTALDLLRQVMTVTFIIALVVAGSALLPFFAVAIAAAGATLLATAWVLRGDVPVRPSFVFAEWRELAHDILPFAVATAVNVLYFRVAIIVMSLIASPREVGYFSASFRVIDVLVMVPGLLVSTAFPVFSRAARDDRERLRYAVQRTYEASSALGGATALGLALGAPFVIAVVAGAQYAPAAPVLRIQAFALAATFAAVIWGYALLSLRRHRELLVVNTVALALATVLTLVLAEAGGARGAAVATVAGELGLCIAAGVALRRASPDLAPRLGNLVPIGIAGACGAAVALVPGLPDVVTAILGVAIYTAVLWRLGGIPAELVVEIRRLASSIRPARPDAAAGR